VLEPDNKPVSTPNLNVVDVEQSFPRSIAWLPSSPSARMGKGHF
jgi:hypothetical protein